MKVAIFAANGLMGRHLCQHFISKGDEVFALFDRCPHKQGPLSQGIVYDKRVACPLHNWVIDMESGEATGPDEGCTRTFDTKVEDGVVYISL